MREMHIVLATRNRKKLMEMTDIIRKGLKGSEITMTIHTPDEFPRCGEVEENGTTFEENAVKKALYMSRCADMTAIADDSGLEVDALKGAPGVFSARYAGEAASDRANLEKLQRDMESVPVDRRGGRFVCCIALASGRDVKTFSGVVEGAIGREPRGDKGFGYDPLFIPEGRNRTFAEMSDDEKHALSHRGKALKKLQQYLEQLHSQ